MTVVSYSVTISDTIELLHLADLILKQIPLF